MLKPRFWCGDQGGVVHLDVGKYQIVLNIVNYSHGAEDSNIEEG